MSDAESKLAELVAILGPDPVGRAKALLAQEARLKRVKSHAGTAADKLDEELQLADDAARRAGFDAEITTAAGAIDTLRAALAEKDALLQQQADAHKAAIVTAKRSGFISAVGALHNSMPEGFAETDSDKVIGRVAVLVREQATELENERRAHRGYREEAQRIDKNRDEEEDALRAENARLQARVNEADALIDFANRADLETERAMWVIRLSEYEAKWKEP